MKTIFRKYSYGLPFFIGVVLFFISRTLDASLSDLFLNISASLITIPIVIFSYEKIKEHAEVEANKETSEFVKMNLDTEILNILSKISRILFGNIEPKQDTIIKFLSLNKDSINQNLKEIDTIVFWLATDWDVNEERLTNLLSNQLIYQNLSVEERNSFIKLIKNLRSFEYATSPKYFMATGARLEGFRIVDGKNVDESTEFKNRFLLLKETKIVDKFIVAGFNDIKLGKYDIDLLTPMKCNEEGRRLLLSAALELINCVNVWLNSRGEEFILDSKEFRTRRS